MQPVAAASDSDQGCNIWGNGCGGGCGCGTGWGAVGWLAQTGERGIKEEQEGRKGFQVLGWKGHIHYSNPHEDSVLLCLTVLWCGRSLILKQKKSKIHFTHVWLQNCQSGGEVCPKRIKSLQIKHGEMEANMTEVTAWKRQKEEEVWQ